MCYCPKWSIVIRCSTYHSMNSYFEFIFSGVKVIKDGSFYSETVDIIFGVPQVSIIRSVIIQYRQNWLINGVVQVKLLQLRTCYHFI